MGNACICCASLDTLCSLAAATKCQAMVNVKDIQCEIKIAYVESGRVGSTNELGDGEHTANLSTSVKLRTLNAWRSLSATVEQIPETQLA